MKLLVTAAEELAVRTLTENREMLEKIAVRLAEVELIEREELEEILGREPEEEDAPPPAEPAIEGEDGGPEPEAGADPEEER